MKILFALCVALFSTSTFLLVKAQEEPIFHEIGERIDGDGLVDMYYEHTEPTDAPTTHSVTIQWEYSNINFIRVFVYDAVSMVL